MAYKNFVGDGFVVTNRHCAWFNRGRNDAIGVVTTGAYYRIVTRDP